MDDWIAVGLLIVAAVSTAGTIVAMVLNRRSNADRLASEERRHSERMAGDERMHTERLARDERTHEARMEREADAQAERLAHERREAVRTTAAAVYVDARDFLGVMRGMAVLQKMPPDADATQVKIENTYRDVALITALGWSGEVREAAAGVGVALRQSNVKAGLLIEAISQSQDVAAAGTEFLAEEQAAQIAIETYRKAISE